MTTIILLLISNTFMTSAWYGHLKYRSVPIVLSWLIAFGECGGVAFWGNL